MEMYHNNITTIVFVFGRYKILSFCDIPTNCHRMNPTQEYHDNEYKTISKTADYPIIYWYVNKNIWQEWTSYNHVSHYAFVINIQFLINSIRNYMFCHDKYSNLIFEIGDELLKSLGQTLFFQPDIMVTSQMITLGACSWAEKSITQL